MAQMMLFLCFAGVAAAFQPLTTHSASFQARAALSLRPASIGLGQLTNHRMASINSRTLTQPSMSVFSGIAAKDIDGKVIQLEQVAKKITLVTNVACFCGFTKQYPGFQELQKKFGDRFTVIAFPCNQFGGQEPGTPAQIKEFVKQFGVTFPVMEKIDVNGPNEHPLFTTLKTAQFLIVDGKCVKRYESVTEPAAIAKDIEAYL